MIHPTPALWQRTGAGKSLGAAAGPWFHRLMCRLLALLCLLLPGLALAGPAPPEGSAGIGELQVGILCSPPVTGSDPAPETRRGFVRRVGKVADVGVPGQQVPAALGVSFGLIVLPLHDVPNARMETFRPGSGTPDVWFTDLTAGEAKYRGFAFEYEDELIPGLWRMEAWDGPVRLYRVEFEVLPPGELPGLAELCNLLS